jgi:predicted dehydrogenase
MPSDTSFAWGLIGPGRIARRFADALAAVPGARLGAVYGRDPTRAAAFAAELGGAAARVAGTLQDLLADPTLDAIYIATPHAQHGEFVRACLSAGKPVLSEKPLVPNLAQGQALTTLARERGVFLMEALWTRFLPAYEVAGRWLREGAIGELRGMQSSFCFPAEFDAESRLFNPQLAGGALLDIGIYNLAVTRWVMEQALGACPALQQLQVQARLAPTGVDTAIAGSLGLAGGVVSQWRCGFDAVSPNAFEIMGSAGSIVFPSNFWEATTVELRRGRHADPERVAAPFVLNGFEGEIAEAQACVRSGRLESPRMPHAESLALLGWMDRIRQDIGVRYPFEAA